MQSNVDKHKVFISFKSEDMYYKDQLVKLSENYGTFVDLSVGPKEITTADDEEIRKLIRDQYIGDATVTIFLNGYKGNESKHIDWELYATMVDNIKNKKMGLLIINIDDRGNSYSFNSTGTVKEVFQHQGDYSKFIPLPANETVEDYYNYFKQKMPTLPKRLLQNLAKTAYSNNLKIDVINWNTLFRLGDFNANNCLANLVHIAFSKREEQSYDISMPMIKR